MNKLLTISIIVGLSLFLNQVSGMNYEYKFNEKEKIELNLMALCYVKGIEIDARVDGNETLRQFCAERYGGIDTVYGDKNFSDIK